MAFSILLLALVGGCVDQQKEIARYRKILDGPTAATHPSFDAAAPLTLTHALKLADADNESIASSGEDYIQALAEKMRDAGTFLPTLTLAPTYNVSKGGGSSGFIIGGATTGGGASTGGSGTTGSGAAGSGAAGLGGAGSGAAGSSTVQITGGGGINHDFTVPLGASANGSLANVSTLQAAGKTAEQRAQLLLDERDTILLEVVQSYYNVLTAERQIATYQESIDFKTEKVRDQEARLKLGAVRPLDAAQSESDLAATRVSLTQARAAAVNARSALARLVGVPAVDCPLSDDFSPPADTQTVDDWQRVALSQRHDLLATAKALQSAKYKVDSAVREYFPTISIDFDYFLYNDPHSSETWTGGISANIPIFSALAIESDVRAAWSQYRQAGLAQSQTRRQVIDDVNEAYQNWLSSRQQVDELNVEVTAAQQAFDLADRSYQIGGESNLDRLTQQDQLLTAKLNLVTQQLAAKSNYLTLLRATGGLGALASTAGGAP